MRARFRFVLQKVHNFLRPGSKDVGTVSFGASAILLSRAFPSFACGACLELDVAMLIASGGFLAMGMALRYLSQVDNNE